VILTLAFAASMATAQPADHQFARLYAPEADCGLWTRSRATNSDSSLLLQTWLVGYVSGRNTFGAGNGDIARGASREGLFGWIDQYCAANPLDHFVTASFKLVKELEKRGQR
jgi:hypothetical protein